ncbi:FtsW/RodA/SpoVE family cell cycle protein [Granulicatella sp.]
MKIKDKLKSFFQVDIIILMLFIVLSVFGVVMVYSASSYFSLTTLGNSEYFLYRQLAFLVLGFILAIVIANLGRSFFFKERLLQISYGILIFLLIFVLTQTGIKGARSWINLRLFNLQPSEFAKVILIWASAFYYSKFKDTHDWKLLYRVPIGMMVLVNLLVLIQPDFGTVMIITLMMWLLALTTGYSKRALGISGGLFVLGYLFTFLPISIIQYVPFIKSYQVGRFLSFHNPWDDTSGVGYQSIQGFLALARGGLSGTGLASSIQKTGFLPEAHTDFILAIVGEELGFFMVWLVLIVLFFLIIYIIWKALSCRSSFARYICLGVGIFLLVQSSVNIGALLGLAPITGVPLPFLSYGGSSLIVSSIAIGMVLFALKYDKEYLEEVKNNIRMNEFQLVEDENNESSQEEPLDEKKELIEEKEDEHEEITGG